MSGSNTSPPVVTAGPWVDAWLSEARFRVYLRAAKEDPNAALILYEWNAQLAAAVFRDIGHLEVALRNAYDTAVMSRWRGDTHWLFDPGSPIRRREVRRDATADGRHVTVDINERFRKQIDEARRKCGGEATPGKVIADLPFGFWRFLTSRRHRELLWMPYLHRAFPPRTDLRAVDGRVGSLYRLRNRAAHHEPLIGEQIEMKMTDLLALAGLLGPELPRFIEAFSSVPRVLAARPDHRR